MSQPQALIIDDNAQNTSILAHLLAGEGITSIVVGHPAKLEAGLNQLTQPIVVFLDLEMPQDNGFDVLKKLRANPMFSHVPIIAYTVHVSEIHVAYEHGFDGFLGKPLDTDKFPDQLARILNGEAVWERP